MRLEPFVGERPDVKPGDVVWCRTAHGTWIRRVATSGPRYDRENAYRACWLSIATVALDGAAGLGIHEPWINWPAADVRPDSETPPGSEATT